MHVNVVQISIQREEKSQGDLINLTDMHYTKKMDSYLCYPKAHIGLITLKGRE